MRVTLHVAFCRSPYAHARIASVLRKEDSGYFLVTPVEKVPIEVAERRARVGLVAVREGAAAARASPSARSPRG